MTLEETVACPVCLGRHGGKCRKLDDQSRISYFICEVCGQFGIDHILLRNGRLGEQLSASQRARAIKLVHDRARLPDGQPTFCLVSADLKYALEEMRLASPGEQAANIIRYLGDRLSESADALESVPLDFFIDVGAPTPGRAGRILEQLIDQQFFTGRVALPRVVMSSPSGSIREDTLTVTGLDLTLSGWERYEAEKRGKVAGNYGFVALKFGHAPLDTLLREYARPAIKTALGFDLADMRELSQAGVIDNVMRERIRDAAFVLADLSTDNLGAYWEAGYAEGLGKPVLYICERTKFGSSQGTHFDTNHLTTVLWEVGEEVRFAEELTATLRRSLNL